MKFRKSLVLVGLFSLFMIVALSAECLVTGVRLEFRFVQVEGVTGDVGKVEATCAALDTSDLEQGLMKGKLPSVLAASGHGKATLVTHPRIIVDSGRDWSIRSDDGEGGKVLFVGRLRGMIGDQFKLDLGVSAYDWSESFKKLRIPEGETAVIKIPKGDDLYILFVTANRH